MFSSTIQKKSSGFLFLSLLLSVLLFNPSYAQQSVNNGKVFDLDGIQRLQKRANGAAIVSFDKVNGVAKFLRMEGQSALVPSMAGNLGFQAKIFFKEFGSIFGITNAETQLRFVKKRTDNHGQSQLKYQQIHQGIEVFGAELKVIFNNKNHIRAVSGNFIPDIAINTEPAIDENKAAGIAIDEVKNQNAPTIGALNIVEKKTRLLVFNSGLLKGVPGFNYLVYEVELVNPNAAIREFVYVDAHSGKIIDQITGIYDNHAPSLYRQFYEFQTQNLIFIVTLDGTLEWEEDDIWGEDITLYDSSSNPTPPEYDGWPVSWPDDWINIIIGAEETYNLYESAFGYSSYDNDYAHMLTGHINDPGSYICPNAFWDGTYALFCSDVTSDDVVGHEWGHAYTEKTNNLIYQWQSGALNESLSDIWGETVDLLNGRGTDLPESRWLIGEDSSAFGGAIRDMWTPTSYGDPGKVSDPEYHCSDADAGGVHTNSGIPNHAYALLGDGGSYNGQTITGLGLIKVGHIAWEASNLLTAASDFQDFAEALRTACNNLIGMPLNILDTSSNAGSISGDSISENDCAEVNKVILAVELGEEPVQCVYQTLLDTNSPSLCTEGDVVAINLQNWETGQLDTGWTVGIRNETSGFVTPDWSVVNRLHAGTPPDPVTGDASLNAAFVNDLNTDCSLVRSGVLYLQSPIISIPNVENFSPKLAFDHWFATELDWDGGNVKIRVNGGGYQLIRSSAYTFNGYNTSLIGTTNPMTGESVFSGTDGGSTGGSWVRSLIDLSAYVQAGDEIQLRFEFGVDQCMGIEGWYVDNVLLYYCGAGTSGTTQMHVSDINVIENPQQGPWKNAEASVAIVDERGAPVQGATVEGEFSGCTADGESAVTDSFGTVTVTSEKTKDSSCEWSFCVSDVTLSGFAYAPTLNVVRCGSTGVPPTIGNVVGTVSDLSNNPIMGASVNSDGGQFVSTDENGYYTLTDVPSGSRLITASADGYDSSIQSIDVIDGETVTLDFPLTETATSSGSGTVKVNVKDAANNNAISEAVVVADSSETCTTNRPGKCTLNAVPEGLRTINVSKEGYYFNSQTVDVSDGQTYTLNFYLQQLQ